MDFVLLPGGEFQMLGRKFNITQPFFISTTPVTQDFYRTLTSQNPSHFRNVKFPVERVAWVQSIQFCNLLSEITGMDCIYRINKKRISIIDDVFGFRLPTEAEWFYSAQGGTNTRFAGGNQIDAVGWYEDNSEKRTHSIKKKSPNPWGLYLDLFHV